MACKDCFTGTVREDVEPTGRFIYLHGRKTYLAEPEGEAEGIIVIVPDAFGIDFINNQVLCDHYAQKSNFKVYLPDFMDGYCAPVSMLTVMENLLENDIPWWAWFLKIYYIIQCMMGFIPWAYKNRHSVSFPKITSWIDRVRCGDEGNLPIGAAGFCWGGKHTFRLAAGLKASNGKPLIDAGFTAHPSKVDIPAEVEAVKIPISVANGDRDFVLGIEGLKQMEGILKKKEDVDTEVICYYGAGHGFSVRADFNDDRMAQQAAEAEDQAVRWFKKCFANVSY